MYPTSSSIVVISTGLIVFPMVFPSSLINEIFFSSLKSSTCLLVSFTYTPILTHLFIAGDVSMMTLSFKLNNIFPLTVSRIFAGQFILSPTSNLL
jgi:hypothetical protein